MKRLGKYLSSEWFLFGLFSTIIIITGTIATPYRALNAHPGTVYLGADFYIEDYSIYAGDMLQGLKGRLTVMDKHTTEPHQGTLVHEEYLLWGKALGFLGIGNLLAFQLSRIIFGAILLLVLYSFLRLILPSNLRKLAFFLILFSAGITIITKSPEGQWIIRNHMEWFTEIDVFQRFTVLMHYLLGNIFFLLSLFFILKTFIGQKIIISILKIKFKDIKINPLVLTIISGMGMVFTHPANILVFYVMICIYLLFSTIIGFSVSGFKFSSLRSKLDKEAIPALLFFLFTAPVLLYYRSQFFLPVWNQISAWDNTTQYIFPLKEYALTIGPTFFLAPLGLLAFFSRRFVKENNQKFYVSLILLSWILSYFILIYYSYPFLHTSQIRFMQNFVFIPFGILAAIAIVWLSQLFSSLLLNLSTKTVRLANKFPVFITFIFILAILIISLPTYYRSMELKLTAFNPNDSVVFPGKTWVEAISWLGKNSKPNEAVLSAWHAGHTIPYVSGNTVYVGHVLATINRQEKEKKLYKFLGSQMTQKETKEFLKETRTNYLFFGYQEKYSGLKPETLPFLTKIFDNQDVQIYRIFGLD